MVRAVPWVVVSAHPCFVSLIGAVGAETRVGPAVRQCSRANDGSSWQADGGGNHCGGHPPSLRSGTHHDKCSRDSSPVTRQEPVGDQPRAVLPPDSLSRARNEYVPETAGRKLSIFVDQCLRQIRQCVLPGRLIWMSYTSPGGRAPVDHTTANIDPTGPVVGRTMVGTSILLLWAVRSSSTRYAPANRNRSNTWLPGLRGPESKSPSPDPSVTVCWLDPLTSHRAKCP